MSSNAQFDYIAAVTLFNDNHMDNYPTERNFEVHILWLDCKQSTQKLLF